MNQDEPTQETPETVEPPATSQPDEASQPETAEPGAMTEPVAEAAGEAEEASSPLQSLKPPSVRHPVLPWITGEPVAVVNPGTRLWYVGMLREPLITALIAVGVSILGGAVRLTFDSQLTMGRILSAAPVVGVIVFCFSTAIPSEIRITRLGVGVLNWREAARDWPGRFFPNGAGAEFRVIASGTYLTAPGREPIRVHLPRFVVARAARLAGLRLERTASWWIWMCLSWPGLFMWWVVPSLGGGMMLMGLVVRTFSRLASGEPEEELLRRP